MPKKYKNSQFVLYKLPSEKYKILLERQKETRSYAMKEKKSFRIKPGTKLFLATTPFLLVYIIMKYLPMYGWAYAFFDYKPGLDLFDCEYVGFKYFTHLFANPIQRRETLRVLRNTFVMSGLGMLTSFIPMAFAILLNEIPWKRYKKLIQTTTTFPNFASWILVYALAFGMFSVDGGAVNIILKKLGLIEAGINFLASSKHVWITMLAYNLWKGLGWGSIVYLAGISALDPQLFDAAAVDGAGKLQKIWHITIPGLLPTFLVLFIMNIGNFLNNGFDQYYVFSNAFNKDKLEVLDLYVYNLGFQGGNYAFSTAVGILKSLVGLALLLFANWLSGKVRDDKIF